MATNKLDPRIQVLLQAYDQAYGTRSWHGTTLRGSLRGLTPELALWRPARERHNIWEYILHTAYWKYIVRRRLTADRSLSFPRTPSDWPDPPERGGTAELKTDLALLRKEHEALRETIAAFPASRLARRAPESKWTYLEHIQGITAHDLYHTGQIQLVKRLRGTARSGS